MGSNYKYFLIPFENVPATPTYTVWFATWTRDRPVIEPGMNPPMVVGVIADDKALPPGASRMGGGSKDPPPPPPPPPRPSFGETGYQRAIDDWLTIGRGED